MALSPDKLTNMLVTAILKNDAGGIASMVSMGADLNRSDPKGNTPLIIAATDPREHSALIALLAAKANPNAPGANGKLPLHSVLRMKDEKNMAAALELLINAGANPNLQERLQGGALPMTPLQVAMTQLRSDKIIERLLRLGADPSKGEEPALGVVAPLHMLAMTGRYALLEVASLCGADLNKPDAEGRTPLMLAARNGAAKTVETLIECRADPLIKDKRGMDAAAHARAAPPEVDFRPIIKIMMQASNDQGLRRELDLLRADIEHLKRLVETK